MIVNCWRRPRGGEGLRDCSLGGSRNTDAEGETVAAVYLVICKDVSQLSTQISICGFLTRQLVRPYHYTEFSEIERRGKSFLMLS